MEAIWEIWAVSYGNLLHSVQTNTTTTQFCIIREKLFHTAIVYNKLNLFRYLVINKFFYSSSRFRTETHFRDLNEIFCSSFVDVGSERRLEATCATRDDILGMMCEWFESRFEKNIICSSI